MPCTTIRVSGSSSLNGAMVGIEAPKHMPTFVTTLLGDYFFVLDVLEFYPTQVGSPLLESAIRIEIRVDLHRHFECQSRCCYFATTEVVVHYTTFTFGKSGRHVGLADRINAR